MRMIAVILLLLAACGRGPMSPCPANPIVSDGGGQQPAKVCRAPK